MLVAVAHPTVRQLTVELLEREHSCWRIEPLDSPSDLARTLTSTRPDLVVVDAADFPRCCRDALDGFPRERVVVVGPEPDAAYERAARRAGAGAWLARDRLAEDLSAATRTALGCSHAGRPDGPVGHCDRRHEATAVASPSRH